ncbi:hypothetical protein [Phenylobacterium sp.]|uniref:hypothetical protein n=1 Tax=Phenylobacterium sp. TaxID=1871053 RepID=UPI003BAA0950
MLEGLVDCAYGLATTLAAAAKTEVDTGRCLQLVEGFTKCTFALRMGIRLCRTLRAPPKAAPTDERAEASERERAEHEPVERGERPELERERDRDYEPVSLPKFLSTLGVVARDAARLEDRLPPEAAQLLPTLRDLLAQAKADPPSPEPGPSRPTGVAVLTRPPNAATRHKLLGSAAPPRPGPRAPPGWPSSA